MGQHPGRRCIGCVVCSGWKMKRKRNIRRVNRRYTCEIGLLPGFACARLFADELQDAHILSLHLEGKSDSDDGKTGHRIRIPWKGAKKNEWAHPAYLKSFD